MVVWAAAPAAIMLRIIKSAGYNIIVHRSMMYTNIIDVEL